MSFMGKKKLNVFSPKTYFEITPPVSSFKIFSSGLAFNSPVVIFESMPHTWKTAMPPIVTLSVSPSAAPVTVNQS